MLSGLHPVLSLYSWLFRQTFSILLFYWKRFRTLYVPIFIRYLSYTDNFRTAVLMLIKSLLLQTLDIFKHQSYEMPEGSDIDIVKTFRWLYSLGFYKSISYYIHNVSHNHDLAFYIYTFSKYVRFSLSQVSVLFSKYLDANSIHGHLYAFKRYGISIISCYPLWFCFDYSIA